MDYSASMNDSDHPAEASPWGSPGNSPRTTRTTFSPLTSDPPQQPFSGLGAPATSNGLSQEPDDGGFGGGSQDYQRPFTASTTSGAETEDTAVEPTATGAPATQYDPRQGPALGHDAQVTSGDRSGPGGTGAEAQQRRPQQAPLKLQAKITGLERSGRKDPVLRFDVYVRTNSLLICAPTLQVY